MYILYESYSGQYSNQTYYPTYLYNAVNGEFVELDLGVGSNSGNEWYYLYKKALRNDNIEFVNGKAYVLVCLDNGGSEYDLAIVSIDKNGKADYVRTIGKSECDFSGLGEFDSKSDDGISSFNGECFAVKMSDFCGYYDTNGNQILDLSQYNSDYICMGKMSDDVVNVYVKAYDGNYCMLIDKNGNKVCEDFEITDFDYKYDFEDGQFAIEQKEYRDDGEEITVTYFVNTYGEKIKRFAFCEISEVEYGDNGIYNTGYRYCTVDEDCLFVSDFV